VLLPLMPLLGNSFGWIFTEMGRQPWIVFGLMPTAAGVSPTCRPVRCWITLIGFTLLYGVLAVIEVGLLRSSSARCRPTTSRDTTVEGAEDDDDR
jgi:cytochrome bd ubiquinol oxidase subunit I